MTRLMCSDVTSVSENLHCYEDRLLRVSGCSLAEIAYLSAGNSRVSDGAAPVLPVPPRFKERVRSVRVAAVPLDTGKGIISGFSEACRDIARHLEFPADVTENTGVAGIAEAEERGAEIVLLADDETFIAYSPRSGTVVRNRQSTARGFVTVLDRMCGGVAGRRVLVLGMGRVGQCAADILSVLGAYPGVYDPARERCEAYLAGRPQIVTGQIAFEHDIENALTDYDCIVDATPASGIIDETVVGDGTYVVSPGVPQGATEEARRLLGDRYYHDMLELGVAVMLMSSVI